MEQDRYRVVRGEGHGGWWELVSRAPDTRLRGIVARDYQGYRERLHGTLTFREVPWGGVPVILNLGPAFRVHGPRTGDVPDTHALGFVAGLHTGHTMVDSSGRSECVQVDLTPLGARRILGRPMHELTNRSVDLAELVGHDGRRLIERLADASEWDARFALIDGFLLERWNAAPAVSAEVGWAWGAIERTGGGVPIGALSERIGWSRKRLIERFRTEVGLPPKVAARVIRFQRAYRMLGAPGADSLASIAYRCGYFDQAHFTREVREFAGLAPARLLVESAERALPRAEPAVEGVKSVQDAAQQTA